MELESMLLKSVRSFGQLIGLLLPIESLSRNRLSEIGLPLQDDPLGLNPSPSMKLLGL